MSEKIIAEVSHPTKCCPLPGRWSCYDSEATELEVLEFLSTLIIMLKPTVLLETGCYKGWGTLAITTGIEVNGFGHLKTTDIGHDMVNTTTGRLVAQGHDHLADVYHGTGLQLIATQTKPVDFAFLDSGPDAIRCDELRALLPILAPSGVVVVHDTGIQHGLREHFERTVQELQLQFFMFDTPRGVSLVRKPWPR